MHYGRILALIGVVIGVVGLLLKKASSAGEAALAQLSQIPDAGFPADLNENTWSALKNDTIWAAFLFAILLLVVLVIAFLPAVTLAMPKASASLVAISGALMLVIGIFAISGASSDASTLQDGFKKVFDAGSIPEAFTVSIGLGWYLLALSGLLIALGGVASLMASSDS